MKNLPERVILPFGEIKRIGILAEFCASEELKESSLSNYCNDETMFGLDSSILPEGYVYQVPHGYIIKGIGVESKGDELD